MGGRLVRLCRESRECMLLGEEESWQTVKIEQEEKGWQGEQKGQREKAGAFG
jgi:hypothetical protein